MNEEIRKRINLVKRKILPNNYKKSLLGIIPNDWIENTLNNIGVFSKGKGIPGYEMKSEGNPCIGYGDIYTKYSYICDKTINYISDDVAKNSKKIEKGTLLFTGSGETAEEIGKCICYDGNEDAYAGGDIIIYNTSKVNGKFIAFQNGTEEIIKIKAKLAQGHSVVHIYEENLKSIPIVYPPKKEEQEKISEILEKWCQLIKLQKKIIEKIEEQKKYVFDKILQPKDNWKEIPLKEILNERKEYAKKNNIYKHVTLSIDGIYEKSEKFNRDFLVKDKEKNYKVTHKNDLCYNPANLKFGVICLNRYGDAIFSPIYVTFEIGKEYNPDIIEAILTSSRFLNRIRKYEEGSIYERQAVKPNDFIKGKIKLPVDEEELKKIVKTINLYNEEIKLQKEKLRLIENQQKTIIKLLTFGIVRVI